MRLGGRLDVGVVEDDDRRLAAELEVGALEVLGGRRGDLHAGAYGAGDRHQLRDRVLDQRTAGVAVAGDDVHHAGREDLVADLAEQDGRGRGGVGRLDDEGVAGGERGRDLPDGHHQRVVPRRHLGDDADRLAPHVRRVAREVLAGATGPRARGRRRRRSDLVDRRRELLGRGEAERLAGVLALDPDELVGPRLHRVGELEQHPLPLGRGGVAPGLERGGGGLASRGRRPRPTTPAPAANSSSVAGLTSGEVRPSALSTCSPLIRFCNVRVLMLALQGCPVRWRSGAECEKT